MITIKVVNRKMKMRRISITAAITGSIMLTACGTSHHASASKTVNNSSEPGISSYLCSSVNDNLLLQWNNAGGYLTGTYQHASLSGTAPSEQVSSNNGALTGTLNGQAVTLAIGPAQPMYGQLVDGTLTLNVAQQDGTIQQGSCNTANITDWNNAVAQLNSQVSSDNNAANEAAAQQASASAAAVAAQASASAAAIQQLYRQESSLCGTLSGASWDSSTDSCIVTYTYTDSQGENSQQFTVAFDRAGNIAPQSGIDEATCDNYYQGTT